MPAIEFPAARAQLVATDTTELWIDLTRSIETLGLLDFRGRIVLLDKQGNFSCRVGIQTYGADPEPTPAGGRRSRPPVWCWCSPPRAQRHCTLRRVIPLTTTSSSACRAASRSGCGTSSMTP